MPTGRSIVAGVFALALWSNGMPAGAQQSNTLPASLGDLNVAQLVEVRDSSGQVLLHGTLKTSSEKPKETERKADLESPTGQEAKGEAEVEIERKNGIVTEEEFEIEVEKLPVMTTCQVFLDGQPVGTFVTSKKGKAELELKRKPTTDR